MKTLTPRSVVVGLVGLLVLALWGSAEAQMRAASAEVVRATGRVEVLPKGQTNWAGGAVGGRLVEGDQIRALAGGSADLNLPDGSTILVSENTRFAVTKLDYDQANRDRDASFHVVAGKVKAQVSQAAVSLARTRQSNFNISTPNGVAAVRGTIVIVAHNPALRESLTFVFASPGQSLASARVSFITSTGSSVIVPGGNFIRSVAGQPIGKPLPVGTLPAAVQAALTTAQNQSTAGSSELTVINVVIPSGDQTKDLVNQGTGGTGDTTEYPPPPPPPPFGCTGCGQDVKNMTCSTPPCQ